ncbi:MAG TPA: filamentous hemagglutinin family protein, partial [Polymorphobacter sp.]|nr:filamentous hemagglutinin family protein [Polymorphobacter sp.]
YTANDLSGASNGGVRVATGNLDLRLATLETVRGGDVTILGPGGRVLGGSVVATSAQAARRGQPVAGNNNLFLGNRQAADVATAAARILAIPTGYEGVLTLRGGAVRGFTDGDFLLNQSRLFTLGGGDVVLWSSNGDLNAGQGAKTSASNPPVVVRFDPNAFGVVDQAGSVSGAGIAAIKPAGATTTSDIALIAPVGTVDAGDAGVRAGGNVFVVGAQVANADNFSAGGKSFGVPGGGATVDTGAAASANASSAAAAQATDAANPNGANRGDRSRISVEVLGFEGEDDPCIGPADQRPANCPVPSN